MTSGYSKNAPVSYNETPLIYMAPSTVYDVAHGAIRDQLELIRESWKAIAQTLGDLKLSWAGESAEASEAFSERLMAAQADMFGVSEEEEPGRGKAGILDLLRYGAVYAAVNFGNAENNVADLLNKFADELEEMINTPDGEQGDSSKPESDPNGPVSIKYGFVGLARMSDGSS